MDGEFKAWAIRLRASRCRLCQWSVTFYSQTSSPSVSEKFAVEMERRPQEPKHGREITVYGFPVGTTAETCMTV
ncbi:hypothetical protein SUGI_0211120 [Cryptomeria japonica]|nr:hypothetical protein SUGI_0211120 [Cryptomeria japonica]